jgi:hypothetical protein
MDAEIPTATGGCVCRDRGRRPRQVGALPPGTMVTAMKSKNEKILYNTESALPGKQNNYETAYRKASDALSQFTIADIASRSGASVIAAGSSEALILNFLEDEIRVAHPKISLSYSNKKQDVPMWARILILHYLNRAAGTPARNEQITFKQLEGGLAYYPAFQRRSIIPLLDAYGADPEQFLKAGAASGGLRSRLGEYALSFRAFPRVAVAFVIWKGDDEFPPTGSVIFDSSISDYLSTEDVAVLCNMIAVKIISN